LGTRLHRFGVGARMDEIKQPATRDRNGRIRGITNLDEELGVSRALRKALSMSGLDDVACTNPTTILLRIDGRVIEAVLVPLIFALSIQGHGPGAATRGGPDNCIVKTPSPPELAALIKAALWGVELHKADAAETISIREIELDPIRRTVRKRDHILHLSPKEFNLLHYLMARAGIPVVMRSFCERFGVRVRPGTRISSNLCLSVTSKAGRQSNNPAAPPHVATFRLSFRGFRVPPDGA
jgi:hypothetical protein